MQSHTHPAGHGFDDGLVDAALDDALASQARVLGIAGLQGSGKSTLAAQISSRAKSRGLRVAVLSLDDVYLDLDARLALARDVHPLLATRGPPGSHDLALAFDILDALLAGHATALPRFDKAHDRRLSRANWPRVEAVDLVVVEGWCLSTPAQTAAQLVEPVNALEREEDADGTWRRYCNDALALQYPALWQRIDRLLWLRPPGFDIVATWRWQQEQSRRAAEPGAPSMTRPQVSRFVQHFERVSRHALATLQSIADATIVLDANRKPVGAPLGRDGPRR